MVLSKVVLALLVACALAAPSSKKARNAEVTDTSSERRSSEYASSQSAGRRLLYAPVASKISPTYGPMEGNSLIMVEHPTQSGGAPTGAIECSFGTSKTTATWINSTFVSCRTPKHSTGSKNFDLYYDGTLMDDGSNVQLTFTYFPTMFVSDFKTSSVLRYNADTGAFFDVFGQLTFTYFPTMFVSD